MPDDYIKRSDALEAMMTCRSLTGVAKLEAVNHIMPIPAADVEPVVHGQWIEYKHEGQMAQYCSECGSDPGVIYIYGRCPECGAYMDAKRGREDNDDATK